MAQFMSKGLGASVQTVGGLGYQHFVFAGAIAMAVLFGGMIQGITIIWDREFGFLKEVLVAPISLTVLFAPIVGVHIDAVSLVALLGVIVLLHWE